MLLALPVEIKKKLWVQKRSVIRLGRELAFDCMHITQAINGQSFMDVYSQQFHPIKQLFIVCNKQAVRNDVTSWSSQQLHVVGFVEILPPLNNWC